MALLFFDGFDFYNGIQGMGGAKWDQGSFMGFFGGRWGGQSVQGGTSGSLFVPTWEGAFKFLPNISTAITGCAALFTGFAGGAASITHPFLWLSHDFTPQVSLWLDPSTQKVQVRRGRGQPGTSTAGPGTITTAAFGTAVVGAGTSFLSLHVGDIITVGSESRTIATITDDTHLTTNAWTGANTSASYNYMVSPVILGTAPFIPPLGLWFWIELKATMTTFDVHINGVSVVSGSGDLDPAGAGYFNQIHIAGLGNFGPNWYCDDLYVADDSGSINNDFLNEIRVQTQYAAGPGYKQEFIPATGSNHVAMLANIPWNSSAFIETGKHNSGVNVGDIDAYTISPFVINGGQIFGVQSNLFTRKDDVGPRTVKPTLHTADATNYTGNEFGLYSAYTYINKIWEVDPSTSSQWDLTNLNAAQFGIKVQS